MDTQVSTTAELPVVQRSIVYRNGGRFDLQPFALGLTGGILLWAAFPPVSWSFLGWWAPMPWLALVVRPALPGRHPYRQIYLASFFTWLVMLQWVRLPHWATSFGWFALSGYLACYLPIFIALTRHMLSRWRFPVWIAAPIVWTGLELARARLFTGFAMLLLGQTQVENLVWIQIADLGGTYTIGFMMVLASAAIAGLLFQVPGTRALPGMACAMVLVVAVWLYGNWRLAEFANRSSETALRVGLVQGSIDTRFDDPSPPRSSHETYLRLSQQALSDHADLQLLIWPESMYWQYDEPFPTSLTAESEPSELHRAVAAMGGRTAAVTASLLQVPCFVGCAVFDYQGDKQHRFNSILMIDAEGTQKGRYDKMHPVMFGEYIPLGNVFPWLYAWTPMGAGLSAGSEAVCFEVDGILFCPNICFENTVPHLIRRQLRTLIDRGQSPDVLVTATNDGWFWGSSLLDHHLACGVMRAVETRRPLLIAANTGLSAWIDATGRVHERGPRRAEGLVIADIAPRTGPESVYLRWGDGPAAFCLLLAVAAALDSLCLRWRPPRIIDPASAPATRD